MSNTSTAAFRWLDVLEKEFDNAFVDVDLMLNELQNDADNGDLMEDSVGEFIDNTRDRIKIMCSAWAQLVHKSQTIFQTNCKLEVCPRNCLRLFIIKNYAKKEAIQSSEDKVTYKMLMYKSLKLRQN